MGIPLKSLPQSVQDQIAGNMAVRHKKAVQSHTPGKMNGLESEYATLLEIRKVAGEIEEYHFERITFKLGDDCRYTPDFMVEFFDGHKEIHETKGFWRDDARVKIKWAADTFRGFDFVAIKKVAKKDGGGWDIESIHPAN